ncbi:MAG: EAL domain-containing protein [Leptothrix sp. (in: b-proteobacteria)]
MATVLVVDDHAPNRELIATLLRYAGHDPIEAADGEEALASVRAHRPGLVICDVLMPTMDGYEFVRRLRAEPEIAATEVIFYTATFYEHEARGLANACGVSRVLTKPCEPQEILRAVEQVLAQPSAVEPPTEAVVDFDREHLRLLTDKLLAKVNELETANQRLAGLVESAMDAIIAVDQQLRIVLFNPAAEQMFGYRAAEVEGQPLDLLLPQRFRATHGAQVRSFGATNVTRRIMGDLRSVKGLRKNGEEFPLEVSISQSASQGLRYTAILRDISARQQAERRIERLHRVATVLSDVNSLIVRVRERDELFREACRIAVQVGGFSRAWIGLIDRSALQLCLVASAGAPQDGYFEALEALLAQRSAAVVARFDTALALPQPVIVQDRAQTPGLGPITSTAETGAQVWLPLVVAGQTLGVLALHADRVDFFDDDEMKLLKELAGDMSFALAHIAQEERLNYLAYYDSLTGLANGTLFNERLGQLINAAGSHKLALALIDLVRFKTINDTLGRHAGDVLLKRVAERLERCVGHRAHLARIGADHFAVVFPEIRTENELARMFAAQYQHCFGVPLQIDGEELRVSAKVGIALYPNDGSNVETLYRNAEAAVKKAKASSETVLFYNPKMTELVAERLALENQLRRAMERGELVLHYQPKVDVNTRRIEGVEALVRWSRPEAGLVYPGKFIPLMEETGLILALGDWALHRAALDHQCWRQQGLLAPRIAVNVSAAQLHKHDFVAMVSQALKVNGFSHGVDIEITESLIMENVEDSVEKLQALRAMGVNLSIDDFGTGYSSLAYLSRLPAQILKIDRAFIMTMLTDPDNMTLVSTMISLAHSLRMKVVAEGVETEEEANMLRRLHCDQMQGYLISQAVSSEALAMLLPQGVARH